MNKITIFSFVFFLFSCTDNSVNNKKAPYKQLTITNVQEKKISLDNETSPYIDQFQYIPDRKYLVFVNQYNNSLYFYDYETQANIKKIFYEKEGANGVGTLQGFLYQNKDSVFTYDYNTYTLCISDSLNNVFKRKMLYSQSEVLDDNFIIVPSPYVTTTTPIQKIGGYLTMIGFVATETPMETPSNRPVVCLYDIDRDIVKYVVNYPQQYTESNWAGGFAYRLPSYAIKNNLIVVSFPASNELTVYDLSNQSQREVYAGSGKIKAIKPYSSTKQEAIDNQKSWDWYMQNPSYESILYDKFRDCFYRIARLADENYQRGQRDNNKPIVLIKLNGNLEYMGEVLLPMDRKWLSQKVFVTEEGLNIAFEEDNEDIISFQILRIDE